MTKREMKRVPVYTNGNKEIELWVFGGDDLELYTPASFYRLDVATLRSIAYDILDATEEMLG